MTKNNYWISPTVDGWKTKKENAQRTSGTFDTQKEAENFGRNLLMHNGGGELITQSLHGQIRSKDTINSYDPCPPKDNEN